MTEGRSSIEAASEPLPRESRSGLLICLPHEWPRRRGRTRSGMSEQLQELGHEVIVANVREPRHASPAPISSTSAPAHPPLLLPASSRRMHPSTTALINVADQSRGCPYCGGGFSSRFFWSSRAFSFSAFVGGFDCFSACGAGSAFGSCGGCALGRRSAG